MKLLKNRYRICRDSYCGFETQVKYWFWSWWINFNTNTSSSLEDAEAIAKEHSLGVYYTNLNPSRVVKHLGKLP